MICPFDNKLKLAGQLAQCQTLKCFAHKNNNCTVNFRKEIPCNFEDIKLYIKLETLEEAEEHDGRQQNAEPIVFV